MASLLGPVDPSFRPFPGRLKSTVRRQKFNKDFFLCSDGLAFNSDGRELRVAGSGFRVKDSRLGV